MSNSKLVDIIKLSPNHYDGRTHKIDTITIHCMAGQLSAETCGNVFAPVTRQASSNYGVGYDGKIGMYVEEKNAPWTTSSYSNDNRAITIEVASDTFAPYKVNDVAYKALINLVVDICKRNNIKKLIWKADKSLIGQVDKQNMTAHRWFANTACPGDYLYSRFGDIANKVNKQLNEKVKTKVKATLRQYAYNDPVCKTSTAILTIPKGAEVEWIADNGGGWSKIKYNGKTGYVPNTKLRKSGLSKYKKIKLAKGKKVYRVLKNNTLNTATTLKTARTFSIICYIESGKYKGYHYLYRNGKYYYAKL